VKKQYCIFVGLLISFSARASLYVASAEGYKNSFVNQSSSASRKICPGCEMPLNSIRHLCWFPKLAKNQNGSERNKTSYDNIAMLSTLCALHNGLPTRKN